MDITAPLAIAAGEKGELVVLCRLDSSCVCSVHYILYVKPYVLPSVQFFSTLHTSKKSVCVHFLPCVVSSTTKPR